MWQHVKLSEKIRPRDTLACCWDVKQPTNKQTNPFFLLSILSVSLLQKEEGTDTIEEKRTQKEEGTDTIEEKRTQKEEGTDTIEEKGTQKNHSPGIRKKEQTL